MKVYLPFLLLSVGFVSGSLEKNEAVIDGKAVSSIRKDNHGMRKLITADPTPCLRATMSSSNGYGGSADGYVTVCFDEFLSATSGELKMSVAGLTSSISDGGIHIHAGTSCDSSATQLGHYWNPVGPDPWFNTPSTEAPTGTSYSTDGSGLGETLFSFDNGYDYDGNVGQVVVIHDSNSGGYSRIACGVLEPVQCLKATMDDSNGNANSVVGTATVCFDGYLSKNSASFWLDADGLTSSISDGGVHIHAGTSCDSSATQLGHYWNPVGPDPWFNTPSAEAPTGTSYSTDGSGTTSSEFRVDYGYGYLDTVGKVVVIHDSNSGTYARIACGVLAATSNPGANGDPIIMGLKNQVFKFEGRDDGWYANVVNKNLLWNMQFKKFDSCPEDENMFISSMALITSDGRNKEATSKVLIATTPEASPGCREDPNIVCLGEGTLKISLDGGETYVSSPGDYHFGPRSRIVAHNTYAACSRKWHDYDVSKTETNKLREGGRRTTVSEKKPTQLLSEKKATMIDAAECGNWIEDRVANDDLFQQRGHWATIYVETPEVSFHIEYRRSDWFERKCDFQSLDAWMTKVSSKMEKTEWNGILGETKHEVYDATTGEQIMSDRHQLLRGEDDSDYEVEGAFGTEFVAMKKSRGINGIVGSVIDSIETKIF